MKKTILSIAIVAIAFSTKAQVTFTDAEGAQSTLCVVGGKLQWYLEHDASRREPADVHALELVSMASSQTIRVPGNSRLTAKLVSPARGPDRTAMLKALRDLAIFAGTALVGFDEIIQETAHVCKRLYACKLAHMPMLHGTYNGQPGSLPLQLRGEGLQ